MDQYASLNLGFFSWKIEMIIICTSCVANIEMRVDMWPSSVNSKALYKYKG